MTHPTAPATNPRPGPPGRGRWLPNPLASRAGRLLGFFFLYITEGIPLGFTATAVATYMRRRGVPADQISIFVGTLYLPWSWKWLFGPIVDVISSERFGRRRTWIVAAQALMVLTLMAAIPVDFSAQLRLFTWIVLAHNLFGAVQDVAIDALACNVLEERERGLANGLMFGGAYLGQAIGGSGVLFLAPYTGFKATFFFVAACVLSVTLMVALPMIEPRGAARPPAAGGLWRAAGRELRGYLATAAKAFLGTRAARVGLAFALLPGGSYALSMALSSNLAVEIGLSDHAIASLGLVTTLVAGSCCVLGGCLSDALGRRRMMALYLAGTAVPTVWMGLALLRHGWIMPVDPTLSQRPLGPPSLVTVYWATAILFAVFQGLMYGTRTALFMDICEPAVAATQFSAYMAMLNFVIFYSGVWQGLTIRRWGYPVTLFIDAAAGLVCIALLPWITPRRGSG